MKQRKKTEAERFRFAIERWTYDYGIHLMEKPIGPIGRCWETKNIMIFGALRNETRRRIERVELDLDPFDYDPDEVNEKRTAVGKVTSVRHGTLHAIVWVPVASFQFVLTAFAAGKIAAAEIRVEEMQSNGGRIMDFSAIGEDQLDDQSSAPQVAEPRSTSRRA